MSQPNTLSIDLDLVVTHEIRRSSRYTNDTNDIKKIVIRNITQTIIQQTVAVNPRVSFVLASSGVVPEAMIHAQRRRKELNGLKEHTLDPNSCTPGTDFMISLDAKLIKMFNTPHLRQFFPKTIVYSNHLVPGSASYKIIKQLDTQDPHIVISESKELYNMALVSDRDLTLRGLDPRSSRDLAKERQEIHAKYSMSPRNYLVATMLTGNDILPGLVGYTKEVILDVCKSSKTPFAFVNDDDPDTIDWSEFQRFMIALSRRETKLLSKLPLSYTRDATEDGKFHFDSFRDFWYTSELGYIGDPDLAASLEIFADVDIAIGDEDLDRMIRLYGLGVAWCYRYHVGLDVANDFLYPHIKSPLTHDIAEVMYTDNKVVRSSPTESKLSVLEYLLAVMPTTSSYTLLPRELQTRIRPEFRDAYPSKFFVEVNGSLVDGEVGVPFTPFISRRRVIDALTGRNMSASRLKLYTEREVLVYTISDADYLINQERVAFRKQATANARAIATASKAVSRNASITPLLDRRKQIYKPATTSASTTPATRESVIVNPYTGYSVTVVDEVSFRRAPITTRF